jgi:hypothetical protein
MYVPEGWQHAVVNGVHLLLISTLAAAFLPFHISLNCCPHPDHLFMHDLKLLATVGQSILTNQPDGALLIYQFCGNYTSVGECVAVVGQSLSSATKLQKLHDRVTQVMLVCAA